jgi:ABC-type antimicrobial peptide transport system permease subunit
MAKSAQGNNIKPMLYRITQVVMILFGLFATLLAVEIGRWTKKIDSNELMNFVFCFSFILVIQIIFALITPRQFFTLFRLPIAMKVLFDLFSLIVFAAVFSVLFAFLVCVQSFFAVYSLVISLFYYFPAVSTPILQAIRPCAVFGKFSNWQNTFAFRADLCENCVRHILSFAKSMFQAAWHNPRGLFSFSRLC